MPVTNLGQYGYALNVATSPARCWPPRPISAAGSTRWAAPYGWNGAGALTPIRRFAQMFSGTGIAGTDGTEWYFPQRLTLDTAGVNNGIANPAQQVLGLRSTMGRRLPHDLRIYAFGARLSGPGDRC